MTPWRLQIFCVDPKRIAISGKVRASVIDIPDYTARIPKSAVYRALYVRMCTCVCCTLYARMCTCMRARVRILHLYTTYVHST